MREVENSLTALDSSLANDRDFPDRFSVNVNTQLFYPLLQKVSMKSPMQHREKESFYWNRISSKSEQ